MASRIARCSYLFRSNAEKNIVSLHRTVMMRLSDTTSSSKICYGTRGADDAELYLHEKKIGNNEDWKQLINTGKEDTHVHIPLDRLTVSYSRSSGPGGQHVNKVNTKAEVRFHLHTADWIPEDVRQKLLEKNKNRINKAGELLVTSEMSRSQQRNLSDCIQKIGAIIAEASEKPRQASAEDIALRAARLEKRNKERLKQKKINSAIKNSRRVDFD